MSLRPSSHYPLTGTEILHAEEILKNHGWQPGTTEFIYYIGTEVVVVDIRWEKYAIVLTYDRGKESAVGILMENISRRIGVA